MEIQLHPTKQKNETTVKKFTDENIRITTVLSPINFVYDYGHTNKFQHLIFQSNQNGICRKWKGIFSKVDGLHYYKLTYIIEQDRLYKNQTINKVIYVENVKRIPFTKQLLIGLLTQSQGMTNTQARAVLGKHFAILPKQDSTSIQSEFEPIEIRRVIQWCGNERWYKELEEKIEYFSEWYIEVLSPPYNFDTLVTLSKNAICKLIRIAILEPWKMCFWWLCIEDALLEELSVKDAKTIATRFKGNFPSEIQQLSDAYHYKPFGTARDFGDSYVEYKVMHECLPENVFRTGISLGVFNIDTGMVQPDDARVYVVGDLLCESKVVKYIVDAVTSSEDDTEMRPESARWPQCDPEARELNSEQQQAVYNALSHRLHIISGKPGTGKTTYVMRAIYSAFKRKMAVVVAFTGMAAQKLRTSVGTGITAHKIVDIWKRTPVNKYSFRRVLIIEEASNVSMRLMLALLTALGSSIRRIYLFGDHRQMPPPGGGASLLKALIARYSNTDLVSNLTISMRVTDTTGILLRDLDRIYSRSLDDGFEWSYTHPTHPFVFVRAGRTVQENVMIVRKILQKRGINDPDSEEWDRWQIMVHTNDYRREFARRWFESSRFYEMQKKDQRVYNEHAFYLGEKIMFIKNSNSPYKPRGAMFSSDAIMNGTVGTIAIIFDENPNNPGCIHRKLYYTGDQPSGPGFRRWIGIVPQGLRILLNHYDVRNIERVPPTTVSKNQGQETDIAIVVLPELDHMSSDTALCLGKTGIYTACSRGRQCCIVVTELDPGCEPSLGCCPAPLFRKIIMNGRDIPQTDLHKKFPQFSTIESKVKCNYYGQSTKYENEADYSSDDEFEKKADEKRKKRTANSDHTWEYDGTEDENYSKNWRKRIR